MGDKYQRMKWAFSLENKMKASATLLLLCGVVLFSNYRLKRLSGKVAESVQTIYEDRIVVQHLIFSYSQILDVLDNESYGALHPREYVEIHNKVTQINTQYGETVLTEEEDSVFNVFSEKLDEATQSNLHAGTMEIDRMKLQLKRLDEIQMEEATAQLDIIRKAQGSQSYVYYLETVILIVLLLIAQILIVSNVRFGRLTEHKRISMN